MTNREKLIDLLTECDGKVDVIAIDRFLFYSPLNVDGRKCMRCEVGKGCSICTARWLNGEAKE